MARKLTADQILVTAHHDGRYGSEEMKAQLAHFIGQRAWTIEGVEFAESLALGTTGEPFITITQTRYHELAEAERKMKELA